MVDPCPDINLQKTEYKILIIIHNVIFYSTYFNLSLILITIFNEVFNVSTLSMSRMFTLTYVAQSTRILRLLVMVHRDLLEASPFMYGVAVEMRRKYEGMVNVSMGS